MDVMELVVEKLRKLTDARYIYFFNRADDGIWFLFNHFKDQGRRTVFMPDCGGWFSYEKFAKRSGLNRINIKTNNALIDIDDFKKKIVEKSFFIFHSYGGYIVKQDVLGLKKICDENDCIFINDISGTIGSDLAKFGDYIVCSTRNYKPLWLGFGGFIATNENLGFGILDHIDLTEHENYFEELNKAIDSLDDILLFWKKIRDEVRTDLEKLGLGKNIIHKDTDCINLIVAYDDESIKQRLINYCNSKIIEYIECPNYIKVNSNAISIEVKRINFKNSAHYNKAYSAIEDE